ncbi:MAG: class I SAM-dependent methyltransferase [Minisyncoccales bacterium]
MEEIEEIKKRYERRKLLSENTRYSYFNKGNLFIVQEKQRKLLDLLHRQGFRSLKKMKILEVGCGNGGWLRDFVQWGAHSENLYGIDLLKDRIEEAKKINPNFNFLCANAEKLDFDDKSFDIVIVATCFTSILDAKMKKNIAREILRVVKIGGIILWYDFRFDNPWNPDVKGIEKKEIKELFGDCDYNFNLTTLLPPLARRLAPLSLLACELLAKIPFLKTHYLVVIKKKQSK